MSDSLGATGPRGLQGSAQGAGSAATGRGTLCAALKAPGAGGAETVTHSNCSCRACRVCPAVLSVCLSVDGAISGADVAGRRPFPDPRYGHGDPFGYPSTARGAHQSADGRAHFFAVLVH